MFTFKPMSSSSSGISNSINLTTKFLWLLEINSWGPFGVLITLSRYLWSKCFRKTFEVGLSWKYFKIAPGPDPTSKIFLILISPIKASIFLAASKYWLKNNSSGVPVL